jgi:predicted metal-dependent hydrolase
MKYTLIRSSRRKRSLSLKLTPAGELVVRAPRLTPKFLIDQFVTNKSSWIARQRTLLTQSPAAAPTPHFSEQELKGYIYHQLAHYSHLMDLHPTEVKFTKVKSYWGNCSTQGVLAQIIS